MVRRDTHLAGFAPRELIASSCPRALRVKHIRFKWVLIALAVIGARYSSADVLPVDNDFEHTENGSLINDSAPFLRIGVGSEPFGNGRNAVLNFRLPDFGTVNE